MARRMAILVAAVAMIGVIAIPAAAPAKAVKKHKTTLVFENMVFLPEGLPIRAERRADTGYWMLYGRLTSKKAKCSDGRKVIIKYKEDTGPKRTLGVDHSDSEGSFALRIHITDFPIAAESITATAPKRKLSKRALCKAATDQLPV